MRLFPATQREGSGEPAPRRSLLLPVIAGGVPVPPAPSGAWPLPVPFPPRPLRSGFLLWGRRLGDVIFEGSAIAFAVLVVGLVFAVVVSLWLKSQEAFGAFGYQLFFGDVWLPGGQPPLYGSLPLVWGTLVTSAIAVMIGVPVSIFIAVFLSELAPPWLRAPVSVIVELLAAIPSVVYGLWGIFFLAPFLRDNVYPRLQAHWGWTGLVGGNASGYSVLTAGILLAIMIIPTVSALSREVLRAVPVSQREAAFALGATRWETIRRAVLPYGRTGLFGATILGLARAIGETMAVTMVIGNRNSIFSSLLSPGNTIPSTLANETYEASGIHLSALFGLGIILFIIALLVNIAARLFLHRMRARAGEGKSRRSRSAGPPLTKTTFADILRADLRGTWPTIGLGLLGGVLAGPIGALVGAVGAAVAFLTLRGAASGYAARRWISRGMLAACGLSLLVAMVPLLSILYEVFSRGLPVFARWNQGEVRAIFVWGALAAAAIVAASLARGYVFRASIASAVGPRAYRLEAAAGARLTALLSPRDLIGRYLVRRGWWLFAAFVFLFIASLMVFGLLLAGVIVIGAAIVLATQRWWVAVAVTVLFGLAWFVLPVAGGTALGIASFMIVAARIRGGSAPAKAVSEREPGAPEAPGLAPAPKFAPIARDAGGLVAALCLGAVIAAALIEVLSAGSSFVDWDFLTKRQIFQYASGGGIGNAIQGSFFVVGIASLMGLPVGILAGIYLSEYGHGRIAELIRFFADAFAEFPSIVIGLFAYSVVVVTTGQFSVFAGAFALAVLMIPIVTRTTEEALHLVPDSVREAAMALGVPKWRATLSITLSTARAALVTGAMLAFARIFGETAPLVITIGGALYFADGLDDSSSALTYVVWRGATSGIPAAEARAWGAAALLLFIVLAINMSVRFVTLRQSAKGGSSV